VGGLQSEDQCGKLRGERVRCEAASKDGERGGVGVAQHEEPALSVAKEPSVYTMVGCRGKVSLFYEKRSRNWKGAVGVDRVSLSGSDVVGVGANNVWGRYSVICCCAPGIRRVKCNSSVMPARLRRSENTDGVHAVCSAVRTAALVCGGP
jgi:hypothetical protein